MKTSELDWHPVTDIPNYESCIIGLHENSSFINYFFWASSWNTLIKRNLVSGDMIAWAYLPDNSELNKLMEHFKKEEHSNCCTCGLCFGKGN